MTDRHHEAPRRGRDAGRPDPKRLMTLVVEAAKALSAPRAPCVIVRLEPPGRSPGGPWLGLLATGPDLFAMPEPAGHALLAHMASGLAAACPGVRAFAPIEGMDDLTAFSLATEAGRLVSFAPLLVTDRASLAWLETDVRRSPHRCFGRPNRDRGDAAGRTARAVRRRSRPRAALRAPGRWPPAPGVEPQ